MIWHSANIDEITEELQVNGKTGLSDAIAHVRLKDLGENFSSTTQVVPFKNRLIKQFKNPIIILMLVACIISVLVEWLQPSGVQSVIGIPFTCIIITALTIILGTVIDYLCELYISDSQKKIMPSATVIRAGKVKKINATKVVQGDVIVLNNGDCVPADARLISSENLTCNEYVLSGIGSPVVKDSEFVAQDITPIHERANMVYSGCWITHGSGIAIVTETGENTELGKIAYIERQPVLNKIKQNVQSVAKSISTVIPFVMIALYIIFFLILRLSPKNDYITLLTLATRDLLIISALATAAYPIFISSIASVCSAIGLTRLNNNGVTVIDPDCIQTLGKVNHICIDKSALTTGVMRTVEYYNGNRIIELNEQVSPETAMMLKLASACSTANSDPTDTALINACFDYAHIAKDEIDNLYPKLSGTPFNHETMMSVSVNMIDGEPYAIIKGAAESIVPRCECNSDAVLAVSAQMGEKSLHVIAIAVKQLSSVSSTANAAGEVLSSGFSLLGLLGLADPLKSDSLAAVKECRDAGINILMLTGDSVDTAKSVAGRMGILSENDTVLTAGDISTMSENELKHTLESCTVIARVTPDDRLRIISTLQSDGKVVAVSGRSAADSAAIKLADVGCATERYGTDVAKYSADVILNNDGVDGLLNMIKGGRNLFQSIRRSVHSALVAEMSIIIAVFLGYVIFGVSILTASQILFSAFITSVFPVIALSCEKYAKLTKQYDYMLSDSCFDRGRRTDIAWHSILIGIITVISFLVAGGSQSDVSSACAMLAFISSNILLIMSLRSRRLIVKVGIFSNIISIALIILSLAVTVLCTFIPTIGYSAIKFNEIILSLLLSVIPFILAEVGKIIKSKILRRISNEQ